MGAMQRILDRAHAGVLDELAAGRAALVFDFDGTLAPIVDDPAEARLPQPTRELLTALVERYPCAVISGRAWEDVTYRLQGTGIEPIIGSHGADWGFVPLSASRIARSVHRWSSLLRAELDGLDGVSVEDKTYSIAVHYRRAPDPELARARAFKAARALYGARLAEGKRVLNVVPDGSPDKGVAVLKLRKLLDCDRMLYVGDDSNDEPVFNAADGRTLIGVRVGYSRASRAGYFIESQSAIDELLRRLIALRPQPSRRAQLG